MAGLDPQSPMQESEHFGREPRDMTGYGVALAIGLFLAIDIVIVITIALSVGLSPAAAIMLILLIIGAVCIALALVTRLLWLPVQRKYPARPIEGGAVSKPWQSFSFGPFGRFNHCLRLTADAHHLHIHPFVLFGWCGAKRISLPWDRITEVRLSRVPMSLSWAKVDGRRIAGPAWCLELAALEEPESEPDDRESPSSRDPGVS